MSYRHWQDTTDDYDKLFEAGERYDVIIYAGLDEEEIRAHSIILSTRSQYFRTAFSNEWARKEDGKFIFKKPDVSPLLFRIVIRYLYCGNIELTTLQGTDVLNLLLVVDELGIQTLTPCIQEYLVKRNDEFLQQYPVEILETVHQHEQFTELWDSCLEKICQTPEMFFNSETR